MTLRESSPALLRSAYTYTLSSQVQIAPATNDNLGQPGTEAVLGHGGTGFVLWIIDLVYSILTVVEFHV